VLVALHAISAIGRMRACEARPALEGLLDHEHGTIRRHAREALGRLR
jgi:HEAT repeat protein